MGVFSGSISKAMWSGSFRKKFLGGTLEIGFSFDY